MSILDHSSSNFNLNFLKRKQVLFNANRSVCDLLMQPTAVNCSDALHTDVTMTTKREALDAAIQTAAKSFLIQVVSF